MHFTADWYPLGLPVLTFLLGLRILLLESSDSETVASVWLIAVSVLELSFSFRLELEDFLQLPLEILLLCPDSSFRRNTVFTGLCPARLLLALPTPRQPGKPRLLSRRALVLPFWVAPATVPPS